MDSTKLTNLKVAVATGAMAAMLAGAGADARADGCSKQTRRALAPFVGEWSFQGDHLGVVGLPPTSSVGVVQVNRCGEMTGTQNAAGSDPHFEWITSFDGRIAPDPDLPRAMVRGTVAQDVKVVIDGENFPNVEVGDQVAEGEIVCTGMLGRGSTFEELRCVDVDMEEFAPATALIVLVFKRTWTTE